MNKKELSPLLLIVAGIFIALGMVIVFQSIALGIAMPVFNIPMGELTSFTKNPKYINATRFIQFFTQIGWFFASVWLIARLYIQNPQRYLDIRLPQPYAVWILGLAGILTIQVLVGWTAQLNAKIPLPDSLIRMEKEAEALTMLFLKSETVWILMINLFIIAIIPGVGEELFFRGFIQKTFLRVLNPHVAIWVTAILFSAVHFQFMGFIPRMLLGAYLGYLAYYTGSILPSMLAHTFNNGMQVLMVYFNQDMLGMNVDDPKNQKFTVWEIIMSMVLTAGTILMVWYLSNRFSQNKFAYKK
jgi:membrane protease YdiL (CAAX protease family)